MPRSFLLKRGLDESNLKDILRTPSNVEASTTKSDYLIKSNGSMRGQKLKSERGEYDETTNGLSYNSNNNNNEAYITSTQITAEQTKNVSEKRYDDVLGSKLDVLIKAAQQIMDGENQKNRTMATHVKQEIEENRLSLDNKEDQTDDEDDDDISEVGCENEARAKYECHQCGRQFKTRYTLTIHQRMPNHTKSRPFVCNVCGKGFRLSSTLCRHKIIHTEEKPHKCKTCNKAFNRSSTLKTHLKTHSPVKEFNCTVCGKGFHQKGNLRNHVLIHTGEKPFKCDLCDRAFNKLSNLKFHLQTHDQSKNFTYRCKECDCPFEKKFNLKEHIQLVH